MYTAAARFITFWYLSNHFEAFRWKVDGSSIVSGITEVKDTLVIFLHVKELYIQELYVYVDWTCFGKAAVRWVEKKYVTNWHCSLIPDLPLLQVARNCKVQTWSALLHDCSDPGWSICTGAEGSTCYQTSLWTSTQDPQRIKGKFQPSNRERQHSACFLLLFALCSRQSKWLRWDKVVLEMVPTWFCGACPSHRLIDLVQSTERQCARQPSLVSGLNSHAGLVTSIPTSSPSKEICGAGRLQVVPWSQALSKRTASTWPGSSPKPTTASVSDPK